MTNIKFLCGQGVVVHSVIVFFCLAAALGSPDLMAQRSLPDEKTILLSESSPMQTIKGGQAALSSASTEEHSPEESVYLIPSTKIFSVGLDDSGPAAPLPWQEYNPILFALKTNLLFDAATALNLEIEVPIGERWSVAGEYVFPWWLIESKQYALELIYGTLEARYWLGDRYNRERLTGWFVGLHGGGGYYDLEWHTEGVQGEFFFAGLSGGYAHTIGRSGRWRMEYSLGAGYIWSKYHEYEPRTGFDGEWHLIRRRSGSSGLFGPTKLKVSLVYTIGSRKGGAQ